MDTLDIYLVSMIYRALNDMKQLVLSTILFLFLCGSITLSAQLSSEATISILTCRPGDSLENIFGHTAIRIVDPATNKDEIFNFGIFSFNEPNFAIKFMRGKLLYRLGRNSYNPVSYTHLTLPTTPYV